MSSATVKIQVTVIQGHELRSSHMLRLKPSYYVDLELDDGAPRVLKTAVAVRKDKERIVTWGEDFVLYVVPLDRKMNLRKGVNADLSNGSPAHLSSLLHLRVYCKHGRKTDKIPDHVIGEATLKLLEIRRNETTQIELLNPEKASASGVVSAYLTLLVKIDISVDFIPEHVSRQDSDSYPLLLRQREVIKSLSAEEMNKMTPSWTRLFNSLENISLLAEKVAELDTRAKVAVGALIFAVKIVVQQINRDDKVEGLIRIMDDLYRFFLDADPMKKILSLRTTLQRLLAQTTECAYFIAEYRKIKLFAQRAVVNIVSNADTLISQFEAAFGELKIELILGSSLQTAVVSFRILETVRNIENLMYIDYLARLKNVDEDSGRTCIRGTFEETISEIISWASISENSTSNLYLLCGPPNYGKSSIAHTVATLFRLHGRVGAALFLSDRTDGRIDSHMLSSTIAFQLAHYHQDIKERMASKIQNEFSLASVDIGRQFQDLVVASVDNVVIPGPVLIIVDGLHHIPSINDRHRFLTTLVQTLPYFPSNFRFLVTARNHDFYDNSVIFRDPYCQTHDIGVDGNGQIIPTINEQIQETLLQLVESRPNLFDQFDIPKLSAVLKNHSHGIQFWISTFFNSLALSGNAEAHCILKDILSVRCPVAEEDAMASLYSILLNNLQPHDLVIYEVFSALQKSPGPLSLGFFPQKHIIDTWINRGLLILKNHDNCGVPILSLHPSFEDYLATPTLYADIPHALSLSGQAQYHAQVCFGHMNRLLKYNLCNLEDVMLLNSEISDKEGLIQQYIPRLLRDSCFNWGFYLGAANDHRESAPVDDSFWKKLDDMLYIHLLHWVEAMSIMDSLQLVIPSLEKLAAWLKKYECSSHERYMMTIECINFIRAFSEIISEAAMQTYISALPLVPSESILFNHYCLKGATRNQTEGIAMIHSSGTLLWETTTRPFPRVGAITCAAMSKSYMAFGSPNKGASIWDMKTGQDRKDIRPHDTIVSIAFSPNGEQVVTGAEEAPVVVSDVRTGRQCHSFSLHLDQMFFAPLVSYSTDSSTIMVVDNSEVIKNVWIRNAVSGAYVRDFQFELYGDASQALHLSPNGEKLAVVKNKGVEIVDVKTGETLSIEKPFLKYGEHLSALGLTWSPGGNLIAIKCTNDLVCIWSVKDGAVQLLHPQGQYTIERLVFSPDGTRLMASTQPYDSATHLTALHIWDTYRGTLIGKQSVEHDPWNIKLLEFLPGSRTIVVCSATPECHIAYFTDTSPAYLSQRAHRISEFEPIPTIHYSLNIPISDINKICTTVDDKGWIRSASQQRILWVPYSGSRLWSRIDSESKESFIEKTIFLEVREPKTNSPILRYVIDIACGEKKQQTSRVLLPSTNDDGMAT